MATRKRFRDWNKRFSYEQGRAFHLLILLGLVSFYTDMTFEGARSITSVYLSYLGASVVAVSVIGGASELLGYGLRLVSGYFAGKTARYWVFVIVGYSLNVVAIPLLGTVSTWQAAAFFVLLERIGKAIRTPSRDMLISLASQPIGSGIGFGVHQALDKLGGLLGPCLVALLLYTGASYHYIFILLVVPALFSLGVLLSTYKIAHSRSDYIQDNREEPYTLKGNIKFTSKFKIYTFGSLCVAFGYVDFSLIAFHFAHLSLFSLPWIPLFYGIAMGIGGLICPIFGYLYDRFGLVILIIVTGISALCVPLIFTNNFWLILIGMVLWGVGDGTHGALMQSIISDMVTSQQRSFAYGLFNGGFGVFWFLGTVIKGILYSYSLIYMVIFSLIFLILSLIFFYYVQSLIRQEKLT
jgi:MFS family permease